MTTVSALICNHNYAAFLGAAIDSALAQTHPVEVVVVDDGSTDGSRDVIRSYGDRIVPILKPNGGQGSALNAGFDACHGDIVAFLDSDDTWAPQKAAALAAAYDRAPDAKWVFHELEYIDADGRTVGLAGLDDAADVASILRRRNSIGAVATVDVRNAYRTGTRIDYVCPAQSALSFRRTALARILPLPAKPGVASDEATKFAACALFPGLHLGEMLAMQRLHASNAATGGRHPERLALNHIRTAHWMRRRFPEVRRTTDRRFAAALGRLVGLLGPAAALRVPEVAAYLDGTGPGVRLARSPIFVKHLLRTLLERSPGEARPVAPRQRAGAA